MQRLIGDWYAALRRHAARGVLVWDRGVRSFHWLLVAAVLIAGLTGFFATRSQLELHLISGAMIAALIGYRVVWGLLGSGYARFASFLFAPRVIIEYARNVFAGHARRYLGHNPLGGAMVFALLALLALIVITGTVALGGVLKQGPFASFFGFSLGDVSLGLHNFLAGVLVALVIGHLAGVVFETWRERENLALAMVTGRKEPEPGPRPLPWRPRAWLAVVICIAGGGATTVGLTVLAQRPVPNLPPAPLDATYVRECGACHFAFPPSIAPAALWQGIMDHLEQHFGEDVSLPKAVEEKLRAYLLANSAEHWDTLASVQFSHNLDPTQPLRITATRFWRRMHSGTPEQVFADRRVGGRAECSACHHDAKTGLFAPQSIEIPESSE